MKKIFCVWMVFVLAFAMISTAPLAAEAAMYKNLEQHGLDNCCRHNYGDRFYRENSGSGPGVDS